MISLCLTFRNLKTLATLVAQIIARNARITISNKYSEVKCRPIRCRDMQLSVWGQLPLFDTLSPPPWPPPKKAVSCC
jgi:hypothetical protein